MIHTFENIHSSTLLGITDDTLLITKLLISVDLHDCNSIADQATMQLLPELLLSGTSTKSREELLAAINEIGAEINIHIRSGRLTLTASCRSTVWNKTIQLVEDILTNPSFARSEIKRVQTVTTNDLEASRENTKMIANEALLNSLYAPESRQSNASIDDLIVAITHVTKKDLATLHTRLLQRVWNVSCTGTSNTIQKVRQLMSRVCTDVSQPTNETTFKKKTPRVQLRDIPSRQNIDLSIGLAVPLTVTHDDLPALHFGLAVLAKWGGFAGRLMSTVREKEGLTYGIYGHLAGSTVDEQGHFRIMTFFSPDQVVQGLTSTFREIKQIIETGITEEELSSFKTIFETERTLRNDDPVTQITNAHTYHIIGLTPEQSAVYENTLQTLSIEEINTALANYLDVSNFVIAGAGPVKTVKKDILAFQKKLQ